MSAALTYALKSKFDDRVGKSASRYLTALDAARCNDESGDGSAGGSSGGSRRSTPSKEVSVTDPQATWVARPGVDPFFAYDANYLIDDKAGTIVDAEGNGSGNYNYRDSATPAVETPREETMQFCNTIRVEADDIYSP